MHAAALMVPLTLLAGSAHGATPVVPGEVYPAGTRVAFPSLGRSRRAPGRPGLGLGGPARLDAVRDELQLSSQFAVAARPAIRTLRASTRAWLR